MSVTESGSKLATAVEEDNNDRSTPALKHISFMLKAAHSLSKYHQKNPDLVRKLSLKYMKQKEKRIRDAMKFFLRASPKKEDIAGIRLKVILVCKALIKVVAHSELQSVRAEYTYLNDLDLICHRLIDKFEKMTEDGVEEGTNNPAAHSDEAMSEDNNESGNDGDDDDSKRSQQKKAVASKGGRPRGKKRGGHHQHSINISVKKRKAKEV